jgi:protein SCO1/2
MSAFRFCLVLLVAAAGSWGHVPLSAEEPPGQNQPIGFDQLLNAQIPLDLTFRDEAGKPFALRTAFSGRPVILVLAYYRCPMLCTEVLDGLVESLRAISLTPGKDFQVVVVSFDPSESAALAAAKKQNYVESYGRTSTAAAWHFLTGDAESIRHLTQAVGFRYWYDSKQRQYAHASGIMVLTPEGVLARYFYGIQYPPRDLRLALVEAGQNKIGSLVDQVLLLCYHYDPMTGKYAPQVLAFVRMGGVATLLVLGICLGRSWWKAARGPAALPEGS